MARKSLTVVVSDDNRDKGKTFILSEMPADQAERWAIRLFLALGANGATVPDGALEAGMAGIAGIALKMLSSLPEHAALPLLEEMFECVRYQPSNSKIEPLAILPGVNSQIEEVKTRFQLRMRLLELHTGFSMPVATPTTEAR